MHAGGILRHFLTVVLVLLCVLTPTATQAAPPDTGTWTLTGSLHQARGFHTATLLANGDVLVAGGCQDPCSYTHPFVNYATAELYHPRTGKWTRTGPMHEPRIFHTATLLRDGRVLVTGGCRTSTCTTVLASAELYNPRSGTWSVTGPMHAPRDAQTATRLTNGQVLVAGGVSSNSCGSAPVCSSLLASAELYDPHSGMWTLTRPMHDARNRHTATLLAGGQVLVAAGFNNKIKPSTSAELYNPGTGTWARAGFLHQARAVHSATLLRDGSVLVAGGWNSTRYFAGAELYHVRTGTWTVTGSMHDGRGFESGQSATLLGNGTVLVAGTTGAGGLPLASAELYDPRTGAWTVTGSLHRARTAQTTTLLPNGSVLVAGGCRAGKGGIPPLSGAELYHP